MHRTTSACHVCGLHDRRALVDVVLGDGSSVSLCGTHALMLRRGGKQAHDRSDLARMLTDRRTHEPDRRSCDVDELAVALRLGFSGDRRGRADRRAAV